MPDLTEKEYDALDELWTNNPPVVSGNGKSGFFMQRRNEIVILDDVSAAWLRTKAEITHQTPQRSLAHWYAKKLPLPPE